MFEFFTPQSWIPAIQAAQTDDFWIFTLFLVFLGYGGLYAAMRFIHRARIIENTPTSKIRSAHQGYVELTGECERLDETAITTPLSKYECVWYKYLIEKYVGGKNNKWKTVEQDSSELPFILRDETGCCIIQPKAAEVTPSDKSVWYGKTRQPTEPPNDKGNYFGGTVSINYSGRYRYTEHRINEGDPLYALGHFSSADVEKSSEARQLVTDMLRRLKADETRLLQRFDSDSDGKIDLDEWEKAQQAAQTVSTHKLLTKLGSREVHRLSKPAGRRQPFLLSVTEQFDLVKKYRLWGTLGFIGGLIGSPISTWLIFVRMGVAGS